jgi:hypothetical protein
MRPEFHVIVQHQQVWNAFAFCRPPENEFDFEIRIVISMHLALAWRYLELSPVRHAATRAFICLRVRVNRSTMAWELLLGSIVTHGEALSSSSQLASA